MTVSYVQSLANTEGLGNFHRLLLRWRASVYKLVLPELMIYTIIYFSIGFLYRFYFAHDPRLKRNFELVVTYCNSYSSVIPIAFILGFFVSYIIGRWWNQFLILPWPDNIAILTSACIRGNDTRGVLIRRTIVRYINLSFAITMTMMSTKAKKRFPTLQHFVEAGLMMPHEKNIISAIYDHTQHPVYWIPTVWAHNVVEKARKEGRVSDEMTYNVLIKSLNTHRYHCRDLLSYDWICVPLVNIQVVTVGVYLYFFSTLLGQQHIITGKESDIFVPFFNFLEFFFFMGWLKVAETLINPFSEDDDDFEVNWIIDRNFQVSFMIADTLHGMHPQMDKTRFWSYAYVRLPHGKFERKKSLASTGDGHSTDSASKKNDKQSHHDDDKHKLVPSYWGLLPHEPADVIEQFIERNEDHFESPSAQPKAHHSGEEKHKDEEPKKLSIKSEDALENDIFFEKIKEDDDKTVGKKDEDKKEDETK